MGRSWLEQLFNPMIWVESEGGETAVMQSESFTDAPSDQPRVLLSVTIVEASNLRSADSSIKSNPYVVCEAGRGKVQTGVVSNSSNPVWNFDCQVEWRPGSDLWFTVFHHGPRGLFSHLMYTEALPQEEFEDGFDGRVKLGSEGAWLWVKVKPPANMSRQASPEDVGFQRFNLREKRK